ncbi:MAG: acyl-CoA/acyl-ACP dehydrogenase [Rhodobacteraceae bacterium]|nr:acyl-CoA/acyl-ACP dehydrogenase [Paracoccaceae bacterium]
MTDAVEDWLNRVAQFANGPVADAAPGWSLGGAPAPGLIRDAAALGLTGIEVPPASGGQGLDFAAKVAAAERIAAVDFGFAMSLINSHNVAARLVQSAPPQVQARFVPAILTGEITACTALTEPGAGSDAGAMITTARRVPEGWCIAGEKAWIINARHAGVAIVHARCTGPDAGTGGAAIGAFVVDLTDPRVRLSPLDSALAQTSLGTGAIALNDVVVPESHLILPPGTAFKSILGEINAARSYVAAMCCAMLDAALDAAVAFGRQRQTFGRPLAGHQGWRLPLAQVRSELAAARALTDAAVAAGPDRVQILAAEAKINAVTMCQRHMPTVLHAMGAAGLSPHHCVARHLGAVQSAALTDGATAMLLERVAQLTGSVVRPEHATKG